MAPSSAPRFYSQQYSDACSVFCLVANAAASVLPEQNLLNGASSPSLRLYQPNRWMWTDCGLDLDPVHIRSIETSPDPPQPGKDLTVKVKATVTEPVEEGAYADVTVKVGVIKIFHKQYDLCEEARNSDLGIQCPVSKGSYDIEHTVTLPKEIPPAQFSVHVDGYTVNDDPLMCLNLWVDFRK